MFRLASEKDLDRIEEIYDALHNAESGGRTTSGWVKGVYPTRKTAEASIAEKEMFVLTESEKIIACARINQKQDKEYAYVNWEYPAEDSGVMVFHTLVVDPEFTGKGYGKSFFAFYESYALEKGCHYLRIDTNVNNLGARKMYKALGYKEVGVINVDFNGIPNISLVCLEKKI